MLIGAGSVD